jgi:Copper resistance protein D
MEYDIGQELRFLLTPGLQRQGPTVFDACSRFSADRHLQHLRHDQSQFRSSPLHHYTTYGRTLLLKLALFAVIVSIGGYNRYRLVPAVGTALSRRMLLRNVTIESVLLIGALALAALLANTPPPRGAGGPSGHSMMAI